MGLGYVATERQQKGHRMLGSGDSVSARRVHNNNTAYAGGVYIDIIDANAGPAHNFELVSRLKHFFGL